MFCNKCGKGIPDGSKFCTECGAPVQASVNPSNGFNTPPNVQAAPNYTYNPNYAPNKKPIKKTNDLCLVGLIVSCAAIVLFDFAFLPAAVGVVLSALGLSDCKKKGEEGRGLAIAGVTVGIIVLIVSLISLIVSIVFFDSFMGPLFDTIIDLIESSF